MRNTEAAVHVPRGPEWQVAYWAHKCGIPMQQLERVTKPACAHDIALAEWVDRCAARLGAIKPLMSPVQALARAIELHENRFHIKPELAAELEFSDWPRHG